jgi:DNA-3-methyladenine glycosylase I
MNPPRRCAWAAGSTNAAMLAYHDTEWGVPSHDDRHLFEMLVLEGAQAGLSWQTILNKREGYRRAFAGFEAAKVARFTPAKVERLLLDPAIVRNRLKVTSAVANAQAVLATQREFGSFASYLWDMVGGTPRVNGFLGIEDLPAETGASRAMSTRLKARGFRFVGPTVCYSFMQATGMVNDHETRCFRYGEV